MRSFARFFATALAVTQLTVLLAATAVSAQDLTHPRAMQLPQPAFQRPDPNGMSLELDNGLVAYVAEDRRVPLVTITLYIGAGTGHGEPGDAEALAAALRRGPGAMAVDAFQASLAAMDADYAVTVSHEEMQITLDAPAEESLRALTLMARVITAPAFVDPATDASVRQAPKGIEGGINFDYSLQGAVDQFENALFAGHVFRRSVADEAADARRFHDAVIRAGNMTLAVAGDIKVGSVRREISRSFAAIARGNAGSRSRFEPVVARESRTLLLSDANRNQGWVVIGHELPVIPEEDEAALHVMDYILGAYHLDSRLYRTSRELRGLTNDNSSFLRPGVRGPGSYSFRTYGRPEAVRLLVDLTFRQFALMRDTRVTDDELFVAKGALVDGIYAQRYATGLDAANAYAVEWLRMGSHARSSSYPGRIAAVTVEQVQAAARKYIHPERMITTVVGPLDRIRSAAPMEDEPQLHAFGKPL